MNLVGFVYRSLRLAFRVLHNITSVVITNVKFKAFKVQVGSFKTNGIPIIDIYDNSKLIIGNNFSMNNGVNYNRIGRQQPCFFVISNSGTVIIGDNVGISSTAFHCNKSISVGNNVKIGGNTVIYDTDFHSLDPKIRCTGFEKLSDVSMKEVIIDDNVFIGAHCTILKGVHVGRNSIIGAGSVVAKSVPENEIWAGNPAKRIRSIY